MQLHQVYVLPSYALGLYDEIKILCEIVIEIQRVDLLKDYIEVRYIRRHAPDTGNKSEVQCISIPEIEDYMCIPSLFALIDHNAVTAQYDPKALRERPWAAYHALLAIQFGATVSRDFLRKKRLTFDSFEKCNRSRMLLETRSAVQEVKTARALAQSGKQEDDAALFFSDKKYILGMLDIVLGVVVQGSCSEKTLPLSIRITLDKHNENKRLLLRVEWVKDLFEIFCLHTFQESSEYIANQAQAFILRLFANIGELVSIDECKVEGADASKFLQRAGLTGILDKLFVERSSVYSAQLRTDYILLSEVSLESRRELCNYLHSIESIDWEADSDPLSDSEASTYVRMEREREIECF